MKSVRNSKKSKAGTWPRLVKSKTGTVVVKVYRVTHKRSPDGFVYQPVWRDFEGVRRYKQYSSLAKALEEARLKADQLAAGRVGASGVNVTQDDLVFLKSVREASGGISVLSALNEFREIDRLTGGQGIAAAKDWAARNKTEADSALVEEVMEKFIAAKIAAKVKVKVSYGKTFGRLRDAFGKRAIVGVTSSELQTWLDETFENAVTRNTFRKRMVTLWRWAAEQHYLPRGKTEAEYTHEAKEEATKIGIIRVDEARDLLEFFRGVNGGMYLVPLVLAIFTGMRRAEIHAQVWEDVHLKRGLLHVTKAKPRTPAYRLVTLCKEAVEWLSLVPARQRKGRVCGRRSVAIDDLRRIAAKADFVLPGNCFRHAYISHRVAKTGNVDETALEAGNSATEIFQHYRELVPKEDGVAWFSITPAKKAPKPVKAVFVDGKVEIS